jgi:hypothetical protein
MRSKGFREEFDFFWKRIFVDNIPTYFSRYADGEAGLLQGKSFDHTNQVDGWISTGYNQFNEDLQNALYHTEDDYFYGISCKCCDVKTKEYLMAQLKCPENQVTYSNLWINGNYNEFKKRAETIKEEVIFIGNAEGIKGKFPFSLLHYEPISNQVVEDWKTKRDQIISSFLGLITLKSNPLVLLAAGPLSEILIDHAKKTTVGRFIDIGSAMDEYIFGHPTRFYMIPGFPFNNKVCEL